MWRPLGYRCAFGFLEILLTGCGWGYCSHVALGDDNVQPYVVPLSRTSSYSESKPAAAAILRDKNLPARRDHFESPVEIASGDSGGSLLAAIGGGPENGEEKPDKKNGKDKGKDADKNGKEKEKKDGDKGKPPAPRTLPEALCEYIRALQTRRYSAGTEEQDKAKKSEQVSGDSKENDAGKDEKDKTSDPTSDWLSAHFQATLVMQRHDSFRSPYVSPLSLFPFPETRSSLTSTVFLDARLWECGHYSADFVFNPELAGGRGFSGVNGLAGFSNGEITRVGVPEPTPYFARAFLRQTWGLGGEQETVEDGANQLAGKRDIDRFTLQTGKFTFTDIVDNNSYSHDPRTQFLNWSHQYNGAWDFSANVRGYSYGLAAELNRKDWAIRYGIMAEPAVANGAPIDPHFTKAFGQALEWEGRWTIDEQPGKVRVMSYLNRAHMGDYREAQLAMPVSPDVTQTRSYRFKYGFGLSAEQALSNDLGVWARLGWNDGHTESWAYTPIDRTAAIGLSLKGSCWARPNDTVGLAASLNGLAKDHRDYLAAGGFDFSIGDGRLRYGLEEIVEMYYRYAVAKGIYVTGDFQLIGNPAYNRDRGPVTVESLTVHLEY